MNKIQKQRLSLITLFIFGLAIAAALILYALKQNINVFLTPNQLANTTISAEYTFRLGGMVKEHSVKRENNDLSVQFVITDMKKDVTIQYNGILPDLFHEGKGVIAQGHMNAQGIFIASQVLAKHDESYMPKNVYQAMRTGKT